MKAVVARAALATSVAANSLNLAWEDCGKGAHVTVTDFKPASLTLGQAATMVGSGTLDEDITGANFDLEMKTLVGTISCKGDASASKTCKLPLGTGSLTFEAMKFPIKKGPNDVKVGISLSARLPSVLETTTTVAKATAQDGSELFCMQIKTAPAKAQQVTLPAAQEQPIPSGKTQVNDPDLIAYYNSMNGASWVAGHNAFFDGMTFDDARPLLGTALTDISEHMESTLPDSTYASIGDIPSEFDATTKWSGLVHPIRNQKHCGSCWAFSASEVMSDRVAIATGKASAVLSPEDMVSCDKSDMGCQGGRLPSAWNYIKDTGLLTDACFPYAAGNGTAPKCETKCVDGSAFTRTKAGSAYAINGVENMQKEIMTNGPIQVAFMVYKSFMSYKSGVYQKHFWELLPEGGHAVKIVGWGTEDGTPYWKVANSWDTTWGDKGYFKILRGSNQCGMETMGPPYAGLPAKSSSVIV